MPSSRLGLLVTHTLALLLMASGASGASVSDNLLTNPSFEEWEAERRLPAGWTLYGGRDERRKLEVMEIADTGEQAILIYDHDPAKEIGLTQSVRGEGGLTYEASLKVRRGADAVTGGSYLQMRFEPSGKYAQVGLIAESKDRFNRISVRGTAPEGNKRVRLYLYTHRDPTPKVIVDSVALVSGVDPPPPPPPPPPKAVPPVYTKLKQLYRETELVKGGKANATIVAPAELYAAEGRRVQQAIKQLTAVELPIASDDAPEAAVPIKGHLIVLGNRSTNKTIEQLYNFCYTLLDLRYPGPAGHVVRTLHNPFGDGLNVVLIGGSDEVGVATAAEVFVRHLPKAAGDLRIGRLMEIQLGKGITVPDDIRAYQVWEASKGYGSSGYFGWTSISKHMAMYYMTGRERDAREVIRLAFPDKEARKQICDIDGERIENKDEPLSGPYHYNAHMATLFWDLIEESQVFTDEERLRVTNALSKQLLHRAREGIYRLTRPSRAVGSRHGQWSAVSLYCLGRYFQKDYPNPIWAQCVRGSQLHFASLHKYAWVSGESDNLFWYNTGIAPIFTYLALSGERKPVENGVLRGLLRGQEMLVSGREGDWALRSASMGFLHKAAYLFQDGRYIHYRDKTGVDLSVFRLGQSFWPEPHLEPVPPTDLVGKWSVHGLSRPAWIARHNGFEFDESFGFGSYRSTTDGTGDYILIDGFNGASRNPYHAFAVLQLRIDGTTLLEGYLNQVLTRMDGMVEKKVAMNAALRHRDVIGPTAIAVGEVPDAAYCNWRRTLVQRTGRYAIVIDDLTSRADSENLEVQIKWESGRGLRRSVPAPGVLRLEGIATSKVPPGWHRTSARASKCTTNLTDPRDLKQLDGYGIALLRSKAIGDWIEMPFQLDREMTGEVLAGFVKYIDRGTVQVLLDGKPVGKPCDLNAAGAVTEEVPLGRHTLAAGGHRLRVQTVATDPANNRCYIGLTGLTIRPDGTAMPAVGRPFDVCLSDPAKTTTSGSITTMEWLGAVRKGQHRVFFSVLAPNREAPMASPACVRVAGNAAAVALPQPALVIAGRYGRLDAEALVMAEDHLFAKGLTHGSIIAASAPIDVDWDFTSGRMDLVVEKAADVHLLLESAQMQVNDEAASLERQETGFCVLPLKAGRHSIEGAKPKSVEAANMSERVRTLLWEGREARKKQTAELAAGADVKAPPLSAGFAANVGGLVADLITVPSSEGQLICAAEGKTVHVLSSGGQELRKLQADGTIRMLRWWPEHELLLVGCVDEQVIAFDQQWKRKWVFTSEMDPAVFRAAKTYWFKSAPGHEGIHGLHTGVFIDGKSQCFVGSACTLEIIDERGQLIKRLPLFWGRNSLFQIVGAPDGSLNLLAARKYSGGFGVSLVNNKDLKYKGKSFHGVPSGHTYVGGWSSMNRHHLFYVDLDGDGVKEVASEINGTWNRVTVWTGTGKPLHDASFGPGRRIMAKNMRDLDIADLDRDGKQEILAATSSALVVALDHQCGKVWARRLPSPATLMKCMAPKDAVWVVVGCEDGSVIVLDGKGSIIRKDRVTGRPTCVTSLDRSRVLLATTKGEVKLFVCGE